MKHIALCVLCLSGALTSTATDGWKLPPRSIAQPDGSKAWFAPVAEGAAAFEVRKIDGAEGEVTFTEDAIRIVKTNGRGKIQVTARAPVELMPKR